MRKTRFRLRTQNVEYECSAFVLDCTQRAAKQFFILFWSPRSENRASNISSGNNRMIVIAETISSANELHSIVLEVRSVCSGVARAIAVPCELHRQLLPTSPIADCILIVISASAGRSDRFECFPRGRPNSRSPFRRMRSNEMRIERKTNIYKRPLKATTSRRS